MTRRTEQFQDRLARLFPVNQPSGGGVSKRGVLTRTVTFAVTDACSLRCTYCYQGVKANHVMRFETARKFIDLILSDNEYINPEISPGVIIEFIGGEPLLEIELIDQITDYFIGELIRLQHPWATRFCISICSNGTHYFQPKVQEYLKKHMSHLSFSISIDGNKELHDACRVFPDGRGSYDLAMKGVRHFVDVLGGTMGSKMTLCPQNVEHSFEAVKSLLENGYREINLNCVYEEGWELSHARILYGQLKHLSEYVLEHGLEKEAYISMFEENFFHPKDPKDLQNWCGGTGDMISVDYTGNIYPCIRYMPNSLGEGIKPLTVGHVDTGILRSEEHKNCAHCLQCIDRRTQSTDECFSCPIAEGCSWCSAYNYQIFGTPDRRATFICVMHKARALANAYHWNRIYRAEDSRKRHKIYIPKDWALEIIDETEWNMLKELEEV